VLAEVASSPDVLPKQDEFGLSGSNNRSALPLPLAGSRRAKLALKGWGGGAASAVDIAWQVNSMRQSVSRVSSKTTGDVYLEDGKFAAIRLATDSRYSPKRIGNDGDASVLQNAVSGGNLNLTEASIWRISAHWAMHAVDRNHSACDHYNAHWARDTRVGPLRSSASLDARSRVVSGGAVPD
jgi:hypothetical protein